MATVYDGIKRLGNEQIDHLVKLGFMKQTFKRNVAIYEQYLEYLEAGEGKTDAVAFTAEDFSITDRHVFRVIKSFAEDHRVM